MASRLARPVVTGLLLCSSVAGAWQLPLDRATLSAREAPRHSPAAALTEEAAAKWTAHIRENMFQGAKSSEPPVATRSRRSPPAYELGDWWEGEAIGVAEALTAAPVGVNDPCFWGSTEQCEVEDLREAIAVPTDHLRDSLDTLVPCVTTDEGCDLAAAAGLNDAASVDVVAGLHDATSFDVESISQNPCFWDEECHSFD